ncbi:MAG: prepilin-type N-terminal cleavage/methylation domain-containing protein [Actinobacteria bacterium]|nr:MAG: prepilin-type N-terminal cleavage/methylation domain-containing protein [Actinomycetota bacterium]
MRRLRLLRALRGERGYSLIEMLIVLSIMSVVMGALTTVFVQASNSELDMNNRFQAQQESRLALDKMRREVHCGSVATPAGSSSSVTLTLPAYCKTGSGSITWCTRNVSTNRYALYRVVGVTCSGGVKWADYLVPTSSATVCSGTLCIFTYQAQSTSSLAKLHVDFPVNVKPSKSVELYELADDIVLRNSTRS